MRFGWGANTPAFRRMFAELFMPKASEEQVSLVQRTAAPHDHGREIAARIMEASGEIDVTRRLAQVRRPRWSLHPRGDVDACRSSKGACSPPAFPSARFVELDSSNHLLLRGRTGVAAIRGSGGRISRLAARGAAAPRRRCAGGQ